MSCVTATTQCLSAIHRGHVQLILGPMFSGKTTELIRRMKRFQVANYACLIVKYAKDDRYSNQDISTHDRQMTAGISATELGDIKNKARKFSVIGIDEGQFFPDIVDFCEEMANAGKTVIVAALDGTFQRKPFGPILNLVPMAESVVKLKAVCMMCYRDAAFTKRLGTEQEVEVIGGSDKYMAVCRTCFSLPDTPTLSSKEVTPIRGGEFSIGRQLFQPGDETLH